MEKAKIICVVGPTASGKTRLAVQLAQKLDGVVVSCDSMQIYRGMNIGTGKPTEEEKCGVRHEMLDVADPDEEYSVARYAVEAREVIDAVLAEGRTVIVAGGTGLYLDAVLKGMSFAEKNTEEIRRELEEKTSEELSEMLREADPVSAEKLHFNDRKRIIRALEVYRQTGVPISAHNEATKNSEGNYDALLIGLCCTPREKLYEKIEKRVDQMIDDGWLEETEKLCEKYGDASRTALQAIGYREMIRVLREELTLEEAAEEIKKNTRHYAKRQLSWFRRNEQTHWLDIGELTVEQIDETALKLCREFLRKEITA